MVRRVAIVPHVHWDREWYRSFQAFRIDLVDLLDDLLLHLETDASYAHFLLDGQMAAVDDYLAVRPRAEDRMRRLAVSGRLSLGPWYVLPDQFLVSGETLVRNLERGLERASDLGGAMPVGYLPDTFGHVAQMPQLLRLGGIEAAVVWRGVPAAVDRTGFRWSAPDGSTVRAEYLPVGYGNGASVPDDAKRLVRRLRAHEQELGALLGHDDALLWMNGTDHQRPQPWLGRVVAEVNQLQDDFDVEVMSLERYLSTAATDGLPAWKGELRSGARSNLLPGVASNRVDVKQAAAAAERALERRAEPLSALFLAEGEWPGELLRLAWLEMLRNAAHDSACACSADEVVVTVLDRYTQARQIADGLAGRALAALGASMSTSGPVVVNPSARARGGIVELHVAGDAPAGTQVLTAVPGTVTDQLMVGAELSTALSQVANRAAAAGAVITGVDVVDDGHGLDVVVRTGVDDVRRDTIASDLCDLYALGGARQSAPVRLRVEHSAHCRVLALVDTVPGFGWKTWSPGGRHAAAPVTAEGLTLGNDLVRVEVDPDMGTFSVDGLSGLDRLVDGGDAGDTYNYSPPLGDTQVDRPDAVTVGVARTGPLEAALDVTRTFRWPERVSAGARAAPSERETRARAGDQPVAVTTRLSLRAGERLVRVSAALDNRCRDHRLRTWFPLPEPAVTSRAECAFTVVERGLDGEGGPHERAMATFPSRRFVSAGGLTLVHEGLLEYELVQAPAPALALTLLRCVGLISGADLAYRPMAAGPPVAVEGAQMQGPRRFRYGVAVGAIDPYAVVDDAFLPFEVTHGRGRGSRPPEGSALTVEGAEVSAVRRVGAVVEVRVFNPGDDDTTVTIPGRDGWLVDLRGRPLAPFDGSFHLRPHGIATATFQSP